VKEAEKEMILRLMKETGGNRSLVAKKLGISRSSLYRKLQRYNIQGL
jgi:transcriptional regulator of acetoin/glycerol metabolism